MHALYFTNEHGKVRCNLCPHRCLIQDGKTGLCHVRRNVDGELQVETYGRVSAIHLDPIEKKPLYHFYPGSSILSIGSVGCNMKCKFCQNCDISQVGIQKDIALEEFTIDQIVNEASTLTGNIGVAFTYNEPTVCYEFMLDVAKATHAQGLKNAMITNGYIETEPMKGLLPFIDAFNVDLKAFTESFYQRQTNSHLEPVKQTLVLLRKAQKYVEITNLIIPGFNDSIEEFKEMIGWIYNTLGKQTILHLSRYFPRYQFTKPATPEMVLHRFYEIAREKLDYVYIGNMGGDIGQHTVCPSCGTLAIKRSGYQANPLGITKRGECSGCGCPIAITV
jgi:pyruvate formate lyase activating enzyme